MFEKLKYFEKNMNRQSWTLREFKHKKIKNICTETNGMINLLPTKYVFGC